MAFGGVKFLKGHTSVFPVRETIDYEGCVESINNNSSSVITDNDQS